MKYPIDSTKVCDAMNAAGWPSNQIDLAAILCTMMNEAYKAGAADAPGENVLTVFCGCEDPEQTVIDFMEWRAAKGAEQRSETVHQCVDCI